MEKQKLVVIGAVAAGTKAASKAKRENPNMYKIPFIKFIERLLTSIKCQQSFIIFISLPFFCHSLFPAYLLPLVLPLLWLLQ